jgi:flagellar motor switch protein FliM
MDDADPTLNQPKWERADFRRPTKLTREQLRSLDLLHDTFARRLGSTIGTIVRSSTTLEIAFTSQMSWDEYVRTLPGYSVLITTSVHPLQGEVLIEMDTSLALALAGRLLGGPGRMEPPRRPTDLEFPPLRKLATVAAGVLGEALSQFIEVEPTVRSVDLSPQLVGITAPSQMVLVLTYSLAVPGSTIAGDLSVVLSRSTLSPMLERIAAHQAEHGRGDQADPQVMQDIAHRLAVCLEARLNPTMISAGTIVGMKPGDVLVLDHRITHPATVYIAESPVFKGHIGRRGSRLALAIAGEPFVGFDGPRAPVSPNVVNRAGPHDGDAPTDGTEREHDARDSESGSGPVLAAR